MQPFRTMFKTELTLAFRGLDMFIFAICMPVVVLVIMGIVFGEKPAFDGADYTFLEQSFGAVSTIAICAGGVMGLPLVIADYRQKKVLKRFKVTPVRPSLLLMVQVGIYALISLVSLALVYGTAAVFFGYRMDGRWVHFLGAYLLVMLSMFSIGMLVGGVAKNMKSAGTWASVLYFPMLVFSGATLPYEVMPAGLRHTAEILPLTQGIKLLKAASLGLPVQDAVLPIALVTLLAAVCTFLSVRYFKWE